MKFSIITPLLCLIGLTACQDNKNNSTTNSSAHQEPTYFANAAAAAKQAKADLQAIIESDKKVNLNIDAAALKRAEEEGQLDVLHIDFDQLLAGDSSNVLQTATDAGSSYVPFVADGKVIAVANIRKQDKGFSIGMLGNNKISKDLQQIREIMGTTSGIKIYQVPNINAIVYEAGQEGKLLYFTDYRGQFTLTAPTSWERISSVLLKDALTFQRTYGDRIKKEKLVK